MNLLRFVRCIANLLLVSTLLVSISQAREPAPVRMESVGVAMRDGIVLATDIYQVGQAKGPVVVMRTPYNKAGLQMLQNALLAKDTSWWCRIAGVPLNLKAI